MRTQTEASKTEGVGSGLAIFKGSDIVAKAQFKLDKICSNNQAEQFAILKALEKIESLNSYSINPRTATIFTDSRVSLDNPKTHASLIENIRKKVANLQNNEWKIKFSWIKAHVGIYGNELADRLAKEAARSDSTNYEYNRMPKSAVIQEAAAE